MPALMINNKLILQWIFHVYLGLTGIDAFHVTPTNTSKSLYQILSPNCNKYRNEKIQIHQSSNNNEEQPQQSLIIGESLSEGLQGLGSEAGYLAAARKRNEEAKAKLAEQVRKEEEEAEAIRRKKKEAGVEDNYGPGDLSGWKGFVDDGFEASAGNDSAGGWSELKVESGEGEGKEDEEEPKLFLFGDDDNNNTGPGGLIL